MIQDDIHGCINAASAWSVRAALTPLMLTNNPIFAIKRYILFPLAVLLTLVPIQLSALDPIIEIRKEQMSEQVFQSSPHT